MTEELPAIAFKVEKGIAIASMLRLSLNRPFNDLCVYNSRHLLTNTPRVKYSCFKMLQGAAV